MLVEPQKRFTTQILQLLRTKYQCQRPLSRINLGLDSVCLVAFVPILTNPSIIIHELKSFLSEKLSHYFIADFICSYTNIDYRRS
eukprot:UN20432